MYKTFKATERMSNIRVEPVGCRWETSVKANSKGQRRILRGAAVGRMMQIKEDLPGKWLSSLEKISDCEGFSLTIVHYNVVQQDEGQPPLEVDYYQERHSNCVVVGTVVDHDNGCVIATIECPSPPVREALGGGDDDNDGDRQG